MITFKNDRNLVEFLVEFRPENDQIYVSVSAKTENPFNLSRVVDRHTV